MEKPMPTDKKIDYIELPAVDFDATEKFYSATFEWTFVDYGPEYRAFNDGRTDGGFYRCALTSRTEQGAALIILYAVDLEATAALVAKNGGTICKAIFAFPGGRRFHFHDPHGNELAVWSDQ
jgi:predicted enzyme related to lactoylglutathione lyase